MNDDPVCLDCDSPHHARCSRHPSLELVPPLIRPAPSGVETWLPFAGGFAIVALAVVEWLRRGSR